MSCIPLATLFTFLGFFSGCVIPLEPEFNDPSPNHAPFVVSATPSQTSVLRLTNSPSSGAQITIQIGDHNKNDLLFIRWLLDYPEVTGGPEPKIAMEAILPPTGNAERALIRFSLDCSNYQLNDQLSHRISLAVSDREFATSNGLPADIKWTTANEPGFVLESSWFLVPECKH